MTLVPQKRHVDEKERGYDGFWEPHLEIWPQESNYGLGYYFEDELCDQLERLSPPEQIEELCSVLRVSSLRELSVEVVNGGIEHVKGTIDRLGYVKLLNSWLATAEETVAAGRNVKRIAARRRRKS